MAKKKAAAKKNTGGHLEHPDYEKLGSVEEIDDLMVQHKDTLCRKDKLEMQIKQTKKDTNADFNEQLKELAEEREHEVAVIDALLDAKKRLLASAGIATVSH